MSEQNYIEKYGENALVVGASATIGEQFARQLASKGMNVFLVARNANKLQTLAATIEQEYGVKAHVIVLDLLQEGAFEQLFAATAGIDIGYLVINANLHKINDFDVMPAELKQQMLHMNVSMPTLLCDHYGKKMAAKQQGMMFLIGAMNCFMGLEKDAVFQGSKAYISIFAESLWLEYRHKGVMVAAGLINGIEGSTSYEAKSSEQTRKIMKATGISLSPEVIVSDCMQRSHKGQHLIVPDGKIPLSRSFYMFMLCGKFLRSKQYAKLLSGMTLGLLNGESLTK